MISKDEGLIRPIAFENLAERKCRNSLFKNNKK